MNRQECRTKRIDPICEVTWISLCARDGSVIKWGRGEGESLSIHVVWTQCALGLTGTLVYKEEGDRKKAHWKKAHKKKAHLKKAHRKKAHRKKAHVYKRMGKKRTRKEAHTEKSALG